MKPKFCSYMPKRTGTAFRWSKKEQERRYGAFRLETNPAYTFRTRSTINGMDAPIGTWQRGPTLLSGRTQSLAWLLRLHRPTRETARCNLSTAAEIMPRTDAISLGGARRLTRAGAVANSSATLAIIPRRDGVAAAAGGTYITPRDTI